jgi:hypothetical protein
MCFQKLITKHKRISWKRVCESSLHTFSFRNHCRCKTIPQPLPSLRSPFAPSRTVPSQNLRMVSLSSFAKSFFSLGWQQKDFVAFQKYFKSWIVSSHGIRARLRFPSDGTEEEHTIFCILEHLMIPGFPLKADGRKASFFFFFIVRRMTRRKVLRISP